jgi:TPP-dependent pyruvate/acetoin dehydrogenase alpha subunit
VCENNGYAISMPVEKQHAVHELARRAPGFGMPGITVDGNDVLAMIRATQAAVDHARSGEGPYFIEAVTYRLSLHTTADDPKVYRKDEEVEQWKAKCPIARFERYLIERDVLTADDCERIAAECEQEVLDARESFRKRAVPNPKEVFDYVYAELPPELEAQKQEYLAKLRRKGIE